MHLRIGHLNALIVVADIEPSADMQAGARASRADEIDDHLVADQRTTAPVL